MTQARLVHRGITSCRVWISSSSLLEPSLPCLSQTASDLPLPRLISLVIDHKRKALHLALLIHLELDPSLALPSLGRLERRCVLSISVREHRGERDVEDVPGEVPEPNVGAPDGREGGVEAGL